MDVTAAVIDTTMQGNLHLELAENGPPEIVYYIVLNRTHFTNLESECTTVTTDATDDAPDAVDINGIAV